MMESKENGQDYGSQVLACAMKELSGDFDLQTGIDAVQFALSALKKQTAALMGADYKNMDAKSLAQTAAYTGKVVDEVARLMELIKGKPDSRPGGAMGMGSFLEVLTDEQFLQLDNWVKENQAKKIGEQTD